ncbi:MAG: hypothetical protein KDI79_23420 [Anaerolineae bacterium]|nr:hypothetical protein [Anaerolineae bacterium]
MASETMTKKLTKHFHFQDLDQDGFVEQNDWEQCARNLAEIRGWPPDSPEYEAILAKHIQIWITFWQPADENEDGKVSLDEYLRLADNQRAEEFFSLDVIAGLFGAIFDTIDLDGDGQITDQDYRRFFKAWGGDEGLADQAFAHLDLSGDGRISRLTFVQFGSNFFLIDEPNVPGNGLFGPYE